MGFLFILVYFILIFIVLEIAVMLLIVTGLDSEIARFQAVSMLTSTGFTTKESELILRHPVRRKIGVFLILFGVFSLAVMISTLSNLLAQSFRVPQLTGVTVMFGVFLLATKNKRVVKSLKRRFHKHLKQESSCTSCRSKRCCILRAAIYFPAFRSARGPRWRGAVSAMFAVRERISTSCSCKEEKRKYAGNACSWPFKRGISCSYTETRKRSNESSAVNSTPCAGRKGMRSMSPICEPLFVPLFLRKINLLKFYKMVQWIWAVCPNIVKTGGN